MRPFVTAESVVDSIADGYSWYGLSDGGNGRGPDFNWDGKCYQFIVEMNNDCNGEKFGCKYQVAFTTLVRNFNLTDCLGWSLIEHARDWSFSYNTSNRAITGSSHTQDGRLQAYWSVRTWKIKNNGCYDC